MVRHLPCEQGVPPGVQHSRILDAVPGSRSRKFRRRRSFQLLDLARLANRQGAPDGARDLRAEHGVAGVRSLYVELLSRAAAVRLCLVRLRCMLDYVPVITYR